MSTIDEQNDELRDCVREIIAGHEAAAVRLRNQLASLRPYLRHQDACPVARWYRFTQPFPITRPACACRLDEVLREIDEARG